MKSCSTDERAVSPVVAVILMVAVTVVLSAVLGTFVLDLGQEATSNTHPKLGVSTSFDNGTVTARVITGTADEVRILVNGTIAINKTDVGPGDELSVPASEGSRVTIVSVSDGSSSVVSSSVISNGGAATVSNTPFLSDDFEDGAFTDTFYDASQSCVSPNITSTMNESGSYALDLASDPGTCTGNWAKSNSTVNEPATYTVYLNKYVDTGPYNAWGVYINDTESGSYISVKGTGYNNNNVDFEEYNGSSTTVDVDMSGELSTDTWTKVVVTVLNSTTVDVTVGGTTKTISVTQDWTAQNSSLELYANGWGSGDDIHVAYDNISVE